MERRWVRAGVLLVAVLWSGCAGVGVEYDPVEDFSAYRTWAWLPRREPAPAVVADVDEALREEIERRTEEALAGRGYRRVEDEARADFFVTYHVEIVTEVMILHETSAEQYLDSLNDSPSYGVTTMEPRRRVYERGHLVIDVAEGEDRQLVWRGSTESKYRGSWVPHARDAVFSILERFPPGGGDGMREDDV